MKNLLLLILLSTFFTVTAQESGAGNEEAPACLSSEEDHQLMMDQLGITKIRHGKNGDPSAENPANYDESLATPFPLLPDPLITDKGKKVNSAEMWWDQRRPEIVEHFESQIYGRLPENIPDVNWEVVLSEREFIGWTPVIAKKIIGHVDNSSYPFIDVNISMVLVIPERAEGPVPVLMMFGGANLPAPAQPNRDDFAELNTAVRKMLSQNPDVKAILDKYPAYEPIVRPEGVNSWGFRMSGPKDTRITDLIEAGWAYAMIDPSSIQADNGAGLSCEGIIALLNKGQARNPDDWGTLRAWSWGAARGLDYLESDSLVDAKKVGIEGVSRYGKAALVTLAFEERFAFGLIGSSGKGGATLHRRNFGESVENLTGGGEYHWMAGNYLKYSADEGKFGKMDASFLPVDSHELIALCAPRKVFISYGIPEKGDANWLDQRGSYMAALAAQPVFRLLGATDMGVPDDYLNAQMPEVLNGYLDGDLAWRQHDGGHTDAPNMKHFIEWVDKQMSKE